ncbi:GIY-YIG nuclease family protein [Candidatus Uhrbacteria bacterium]|nr:GIY-YIG nuclease family protein [Candidatus Uhrbacteria bacterium]
MSDPFTIRIFVPEGDPEGIRIIDRLNSTGTFFAFPRAKWAQMRNHEKLNQAGIYILNGYANPDDELPTIYVGQADVVKNRIEQHTRNKDFWDKGVVFVSSNMNVTYAKWLEYALVKQASEAGRSILENGNNPQEPNISESEKADMQVFLKEIYQTLPLVGLSAFEIPKTVAKPETVRQEHASDRDTIVVPAQEDGFKRVFLGENAWWSVRISGGMLDKIRYIAAYQVAPIKAITHIAQVNRIEPYGEEGKYKLIFTEPARRLDNPIPFGNAPQGMMQGPKYTNFEKLKKAKQLTDLF